MRKVGGYFRKMDEEEEANKILAKIHATREELKEFAKTVHTSRNIHVVQLRKTSEGPNRINQTVRDIKKRYMSLEVRYEALEKCYKTVEKRCTSLEKRYKKVAKSTKKPKTGNV